MTAPVDRAPASYPALSSLLSLFMPFWVVVAMVTARAENVGQILRGQEPTREGTRNAARLVDFGDSGVAFVDQPKIQPRNVNWPSSGKWVHNAKVAFEKYFLHKMRKATSETLYEKGHVESSWYPEAQISSARLTFQ